MAKMTKAVLAVGAIMVDLVCHVSHLPKSGEGALADAMQAAVGGCAFNAANAMRQLGAPYQLFAPVGEGIFAGFVERELAARGLEAFRVAGRDSGGCVCLVEPDGERTMITMPGIERCFEPNWFNQVDASSFGCGFASGYELEGTGDDAILEFFEAHPAVEFFYAPGPRVCAVSADKTARINALHPVWHLNNQEALAYTELDSLEDAGFALARECGNAVVVTAGAEGAHLFTKDRHVVVPTRPVKVVDTVGAGDAHLGALAAARAAGESWEQALDLANRVASAVCGVSGATLADDEFARANVSL